MSILVTGGAGFIGSHVCEMLLSKGENVVCLDNINDYYNPTYKEKNLEGLENPAFKFYKADIREFEAVKEVFEKEDIHKVVHLAARAGVRPSIEQPLLYEEVNIKGTINMLECARQHDVKNFVFGSSSSVYGDVKEVPFREDGPVSPISPYGATKRAGELFCYAYHKLYGMNVTCLRFFTVYGPRNRPDMAIFKFVDAAYKGETIKVFGDGTSKRDYTYVGDIAAGIVAASERDLGFEEINLANSRTVALTELISTIEEKTGKKMNLEHIPDQLGDMEITSADISKARELLGYEPKTNIEMGIQKVVEWYRENILNG